MPFFDEQVGYRCADNIGAKRLKSPASIRIIMVPSIEMVKEEHLRYALGKGAERIILGLHNGIDPEIPDDLEGRVLKHSVYTPHFRGLRDIFLDLG